MDVLLFYRPFLGRPPVASVWSRFSLAYHRLDWQQGRGGGNQLTAPTLDHRLIIRTERLIERTGSLIKGRRTTPANRLNKFPVNWARLSHTTDRGSGGPFHRLGPPPVLAVIYLTAPPPLQLPIRPLGGRLLMFLTSFGPSLRVVPPRVLLESSAFCSLRLFP